MKDRKRGQPEEIQTEIKPYIYSVNTFAGDDR